MKTGAIKLQANGANSVFIPYISTGSELVLVDAGYPGLTEQIESGLLDAGLRLAQVTQIWLTHHDHDHVGSLAEIKSRYPEIIVKATAPEIACIEGRQISLRLRQAVDRQDSLSEGEKEGGLGFQDYLKSIVPCKVDEELIPGEYLLDGQLLALDTSGHTEGHISFYDPAGQTLITGDLVALVDGALILPFPQYAFDLKRVLKSLEAVTELPILRIICYHGGVLSGSAEEMKALLQAAAQTKEP